MNEVGAAAGIARFDLGAAVHEIRTPLTAILAAGELLLDEADSAAMNVGRLAGVVVRNARRLGRLMDDLSRFADLAATAEITPEPVTVAELLQDAGWVGPVRVRGEGRPILGDRNLLNEALRRILDRAMAVTPTGTDVQVSVTSGDTAWSIEVADAGPPVPAAALGTVLEPFGRVPGRTTGLDLAIAAAIVHRHGGSITAGDRDGDGLVLSMILPAAETDGM